ncbi:MAG TPA: hypothetical protein VFZ95_09150 [Steroidobacteraceae bacterium]
MSQGIEANVDWTAPAKSHAKRVGPGLNGRSIRPQAAAPEKRNVMDTLLGRNNLSAADLSGNDPYNATGRHFRR